ncbi:MAG TPA: DUF4410 domain-containing protein [Candidatus Binatia bacterium]|nr:DUF4410 domain-containing protein [Candidatus Binatia bacterium]
MRNANGHASARVLALVAAALAIVACAPASVKPLGSTTATGLPRPTRVAVVDFAVNAGDVHEDQAPGTRLMNAFSSSSASERELEIGRKVADALASDMASGIQQLGFPVERVARGTPLGAGTLVVDGRLLDVDEGNRLRRIAIGFKAGQSSVKSEVHVTLVTETGSRPVLDFTAEGASAPMPGAAVTMGAGAAAQGGVTVASAAAAGGVGAIKTQRSTVENDAGGAAKQIVAYLSDFFAHQGWIAPDQAERAKIATR